MATLALDLGSRKIGAAITDEIGLAVHPLSAIERSSFEADVGRIRNLMAGRGVDRLVVGLPLNMDGSVGSAARAAKSYAASLEGALGVPVELYDERLTTFEARERLGVKLRRSRRKRAVDSMAAAIILESWLQSRGERST